MPCCTQPSIHWLSFFLLQAYFIMLLSASLRHFNVIKSSEIAEGIVKMRLGIRDLDRSFM